MLVLRYLFQQTAKLLALRGAVNHFQCVFNQKKKKMMDFKKNQKFLWNRWPSENKFEKIYSKIPYCGAVY